MTIMLTTQQEELKMKSNRDIAVDAGAVTSLAPPHYQMGLVTFTDPQLTRYTDAIIKADRAQRQAGQESAAFDAQAEQIKRMQEVIDCLVEQKAAYAEAWSAMLAAPPAAPVPEGWQLVPLTDSKEVAMNAAIADLKQALAISEAKHALTKLISD